jgi:hypothetical protein
LSIALAGSPWEDRGEWGDREGRGRRWKVEEGEEGRVSGSV